MMDISWCCIGWVYSISLVVRTLHGGNSSLVQARNFASAVLLRSVIAHRSVFVPMCLSMCFGATDAFFSISKFFTASALLVAKYNK
jgi:hypothetical protein